MVHGAEAVRGQTGGHGHGEGGGSRRDFLILATTAVGAVGAASVLWPFIDQMNPSADVLATASDATLVSSDSCSVSGSTPYL